MDILKILGRKQPLFDRDMELHEVEIREIISSSSFLILGGAGSIGQAVVKEVFKRNPRILHVVDLSENNLAELVRDLRSSLGYTTGEFKTFALDITSDIYDAFYKSQKKYDFVLKQESLSPYTNPSITGNYNLTIPVAMKLKLPLPKEVEEAFRVARGVAPAAAPAKKG